MALPVQATGIQASASDVTFPSVRSDARLEVGDRWLERSADGDRTKLVWAEIDHGPCATRPPSDRTVSCCVNWRPERPDEACELRARLRQRSIRRAFARASRWTATIAVGDRWSQRPPRLDDGVPLPPATRERPSRRSIKTFERSTWRGSVGSSRSIRRTQSRPADHRRWTTAESRGRSRGQNSLAMPFNSGISVEAGTPPARTRGDCPILPAASIDDFVFYRRTRESAESVADHDRRNHRRSTFSAGRVVNLPDFTCVTTTRWVSDADPRCRPGGTTPPEATVGGSTRCTPKVPNFVHRARPTPFDAVGMARRTQGRWSIQEFFTTSASAVLTTSLRRPILACDCMLETPFDRRRSGATAERGRSTSRAGSVDAAAERLDRCSSE